ncbi:hypothetical protein BC829DRAFT_359742 [Chytridium lagenaria]|nr:hypothetical protein BC829DRAFT_359742 [Chytridium lagenaria]
MFPLVAVDLSDVTRFGRSNTRRHPFFKTFDSQVVSRNHLEIWNENGKIFTRDVGSNGGTFLNGHRLGESGQVSEIVELKSGDYLQMGRDFLCETEPGIPIELKDVKRKHLPRLRRWIKV